MGVDRRHAPHTPNRKPRGTGTARLSLLFFLLVLGVSGCFITDEFKPSSPEGMGSAAVPFPQGEYRIPPTSGTAVQVQTLACITEMSDPQKCAPGDPPSCATGCKFQIFSDEDPFGGLALEPIDTIHFVPWGTAQDTSVLMQASPQGLVKEDIPIQLLHLNCLHDTCLPREIARVSVSTH